MAAGNFTASELLKIKVKAEQMWSGSQAMANKNPESETAKAVLTNQTARFRQLESPEKDNVVVVNWVKSCDIEERDCTPDCTIDEPELETAGKEYTLDMCKETGFSIDREKLRTNTYDRMELATEGLQASVKALDEYWSKAMLAKLQSFAGPNVAPSGYPFDPLTAQTTIPASDYNRKMVAVLLKMGILNRIRDMYFIDNGELFVDWTNARFDSGNLDGKGDKTRIDALNMYFDMFNFHAAGIDTTTFLINKDAVAMTTRNRHSSTPEEITGTVNQTRYTVKSAVLPGVNYDVFYTVGCKVVGNKSHIVDQWKFKTEGLIALNPEACPVEIEGEQYNPTGVLAFKKGA